MPKTPMVGFSGTVGSIWEDVPAMTKDRSNAGLQQQVRKVVVLGDRWKTNVSKKEKGLTTLLLAQLFDRLCSTGELTCEKNQLLKVKTESIEIKGSEQMRRVVEKELKLLKINLALVINLAEFHVAYFYQ